MPPAGRPPLERGVHSFEQPGIQVPERLVLDTSFVVEALIASQPLHAPAQDFLVRVAEAGTAVFYSRLLEIELRETAFQLGLKERHPKDWKRYRNDGRARPRAARLMSAVLVAWEAVLAEVPFQIVESEAVHQEVDRLMSTHGLQSYDAVHAATAISTGVRRLVTTDAGFGAVPENELTLYVDSSRLASCRKRRA